MEKQIKNGQRNRDPFDNLALLTSLHHKTFLRRFSTTVLIADAIGPWGQGVTAYAGWLLGPKVNVTLDSALIESLCKLLPAQACLRLLKVSGISHLQPRAFAKINSLLQKGMLSGKTRILNRDVESLARMMLVFLQQFPNAADSIDSSKFCRIVELYGSKKANRSTYATCVQIILGQDVRNNLLKMIRMRKRLKAVEIIMDTFDIPFKGRESCLEIIKRIPKGTEFMLQLKMVKEGWAKEARMD